MATEGYYIKATVERCDGKEALLKAPEEGAIHVTESTGGAWRENMRVGAEYVQKHRIQTLSLEKVRHEIERRGGFLEL
jgi:hypothetical protein